MDNQNEAQSGVRERSTGRYDEEIWGAKDSLRRNAGIKKISDDEITPLLDSGSGRPEEDSKDRTEREWAGHADFEGLTWWHRPSMFWLLGPFFLLTLAMGGILVPKLNLILTLVCREYLVESNNNVLLKPSIIGTFALKPNLMDLDNEKCRSIPEVQALATKFMTALTITGGALSAVMAPKLGALSDRFGRLRLLIITSFGGFLGEIITILAGTYPDTIHYRWLLVGAVFDGLCGSFTAGMALTHAYAADCTPPPKRAMAFGYFHACLFSGIAIGPLIAALLVRETGSIVTSFYFALAVHTLFIFYVILVVPESLSKKRQLLAREKYAAEIGDRFNNGPVGWKATLKRANILAPLKILYPTGPGSSSAIRRNLILLSAVDTIIFGVAMGSMTVVVYYMGYQFHWTTPEISVFTSMVMSVRVTALVVILPLLNYFFRTRRANKQRRDSGFATPEPNSGSDWLDLSVIRTAIFFEIIGYTGYALTRTSSLFIVSGVVAAAGGVGSPTLQSALTKHVPHDKIGQLLGATGLLHALARIFCPLIFNMIYAWTVVKGLPQVVFMVLSCCFVIGFLFSWFIRPNIYLEDPVTQNGPTSTSADPDVILDEEIGGI
ncbi:MFS general substrate transporter [Stipitochalara longipes BDJ]|nr:MFS general substrate transporter [Stipitochalara longipes BDJ]